MPHYATLNRGTAHPGRFDTETIAAPIPERTPTGQRLRNQLVKAENIGKLSRILSTRGPHSIAELVQLTGIPRNTVYDMLREYEGDLFERTGQKAGATRPGDVWRWRLSWKHSDAVA